MSKIKLVTVEPSLTERLQSIAEPAVDKSGDKYAAKLAAAMKTLGSRHCLAKESTHPGLNSAPETVLDKWKAKRLSHPPAVVRRGRTG